MKFSPGPGAKTATPPASRGPQPTPRPLAAVVPIAAARRRGGRQWRKANGLETIADLVTEYLARRFVRPGALHPLPEDVLPGWREARP